MSDDIFKALDAVFEVDLDKKRAAKQAEQDRLDAANERLRQFELLKDNIIIPAMQEMKEYLEQRQRTARVHYDTTLQRIRFVYIPDHSQILTRELPTITVSLDPHQEQVFFHKSTMITGRGGTSAGDGAEKFSDVTADLIKKRISILIQEVHKR